MNTIRAISLAVAIALPGASVARDGFDVDFERYDVNNDGYLSELEWEKAVFVTTRFTSADTDNNGQVDRDEARAAVRRGQDTEQPRDNQG